MTVTKVDPGRITVVSGLPRSGTSMMMQILEGGGMPLLTDRLRAPDEDNPVGYYEFELVKKLRTEKDWVPQAQGKVVKVISYLLKELPSQFNYDIVFLRRAQSEILASQRQMLLRSGKEVAPEAEAKMADAFTKHVDDIVQWLGRQANMKVLYVDHAEIIANPSDTANTIAAFLGYDLDRRAMAEAVDGKLYRQRA